MGVTQLTCLVFCLFALTACSSHKPILYPNAHLQSVDEETSKHDIAGCREIAKEAGASTGSGKTGAVAGQTAVGAGSGAASGAVGGAIVGSPGMGTAVGAASGAVFGFLGGLFSPSQPNPAYVNIVNRCLAERGYEVAGWK
jgi:Predicted membrane protein